MTQWPSDPATARAALRELIRVIARAPDCAIYPPSGLPRPAVTSHRVPDDLSAFYELCGGMALFTRALYPIHIARPSEVIPANPVIVGEQFEDDISSSWYLIASDGTDIQRITIDLDPSRLGRCYDSFWDSHAVAGSSTIIALSFSEFLERSFRADGHALYWVVSDFVPLGDAYD